MKAEGGRGKGTNRSGAAGTARSQGNADKGCISRRGRTCSSNSRPARTTARTRSRRAPVGEQTVEVVDAAQEPSAGGDDQIAGHYARRCGRSARLDGDNLDRAVVEQVQIDHQPPGKGNQVAVIPKCSRRTRP